MNKFLLFLLVSLFISLHTFSQTADFDADKFNGCAPLTVNFTAKVNSSSYKWSFGNGVVATSTDGKGSTIYPVPGNYPVTLTLASGASVTKNIVVSGSPTADFVITSTTTCLNQAIAFESKSQPATASAIKQIDWIYGDGNADLNGAVKVSHTYTSAQVYPVTLNVYDQNGCTGSIKKNITINNYPSPAFTMDKSYGCAPPLDVVFTNTTPGDNSYKWKFGDGDSSLIKNPSHTFKSINTFSVKLEASYQGCVSSVSKTVTVGGITVDFTTTKAGGCAGQTLSFTSSVSPPSSMKYTWDFGDNNTASAANPDHKYAGAGTFSVKLVVSNSNGCKDSLTKDITIIGAAKAVFTPSDTLDCKLSPLTFNNISQNATAYEWDFGDGSTSTQTSPQYQYSVYDTFTVRLVAKNAFCTDTMRKNVLLQKPQMNIGVNKNEGCVPLSVKFFDFSIVNDKIKTYTWDFGNGNTGNIANPPATYNVQGQYNVSLKIVTEKNCKDSILMPAFVQAGTQTAHADFEIASDTLCFSAYLLFTDKSTGANNWEYVYGDGIKQKGIASPLHKFTSPGNFEAYQVALNNGCPDTSQKVKVTVLAPQSVFTSVVSCNNSYHYSFIDASIKADSIRWYVDNLLLPDTTRQIDSLFTARGGHVIKQVAFNFETQCKDSSTLSFTVYDVKGNKILPDTLEGCAPSTLSFTGNYQDASNWVWTGGDSVGVNKMMMPITFSKGGFYYVKLQVTDPIGCSKTDSVKVRIYEVHPKIQASVLGGCTPLQVLFTDSSKADTTIVLGTWKFDNTVVQSTAKDTISYIFTTNGIHPVNAVFEDVKGCKATVSTSVESTFPKAAFSVTDIACPGNAVSLSASATTASVPKYIYDFGDGKKDSTNSASFSHTFTAQGDYTVKLQVRDKYGCKDNTTALIHIARPVADFQTDVLVDVCKNKTVKFNDISAGYANSWVWDFGDGGSSTLASPTYSYTSTGTYPVSLTVKNKGGCSDTKTGVNVQVQGPVGEFSFTPSEGCIPLKATFEVKNTNSQKFIWDFKDGKTVETTNKITEHVFTAANKVRPIVVISVPVNNQECLDTAKNLTGWVNPVQKLGVNFPVDTLRSPGGEIVYLVPVITGVPGNATYNWIPSKELSCTNCAAPGVLVTGDQKYSLTVIDDKGCQGSDTIYVKSDCNIKSIEVPDVYTPNGDGLNDVFHVRNACSRENFSLMVLNRWGEIVFSSKDPFKGWDGRTASGSQVAEGVYFYILKAGDISKRGTVNVYY